MRSIFQKKYAEYADLKLIPILVNSPKQSMHARNSFKNRIFWQIIKKTFKKIKLMDDLDKIKTKVLAPLSITYFIDLRVLLVEKNNLQIANQTLFKSKTEFLWTFEVLRQYFKCSDVKGSIIYPLGVLRALSNIKDWTVSQTP